MQSQTKNNTLHFLNSIEKQWGVTTMIQEVQCKWYIHEFQGLPDVKTLHSDL